MKALLVALDAKFVQSNLAVRALRTACIPYNLDCKIYESNVNESIGSHLEQIVLHNPDVVGFSAYIWNIEYVKHLIDDIRKILPRTTIVLGGPEVSEDPRNAFEKYKPDYLIQGPGEKAWPELLLALKQGRANELERIICMPISISDIEFPYLPEDDLENHLVYYEASRGCVNRCAYCLSSVNRHVEFRPLDLVFNDIRKLWNMGVKQIKFVDRTFNLDKKRTLLIWQHLYENYLDGNFHFEISADRLSDEELEFLRKLPKGFFQMEIGVQSTYNKTLEAINRKTDTKRLLERLEELSRTTNVLVYADLIAGLPYESYSRFIKSFCDVIQTRPGKIHLGFLKLLPGTSLREKASQWGLVYSDYPPYEILQTNDISFSELKKLKDLDWTVDLFYNSDFFAETLKKIEDLGEFYLDLTKALENAGELYQKRKLESRFEFVSNAFPHLSDYVFIDYLKQGLSRSIPSWYTGEISLEQDSGRFEDLDKKTPVLILELPKTMQLHYGGQKLALIMGLPHLDRRCKEIRIL